MTRSWDDPHAGQPVHWAGAKLASAKLMMILLHGRGSDAEDILGLGQDLAMHSVAYVAPQARGNSWYPYSFLAPLEQNEPFLSSALSVIDRLCDDLVARGFQHDRIALLGFSQGACLALEFAARNPRRYALVAGLSGGLIGPQLETKRYAGSFGGTPVFIGCSDVDPHIPLERVHESTAVFRQLKASVDERIYPGMEHAVGHDELNAVRSMMTPLR